MIALRLPLLGPTGQRNRHDAGASSGRIPVLGQPALRAINGPSVARRLLCSAEEASRMTPTRQGRDGGNTAFRRRPADGVRPLKVRSRLSGGVVNDPDQVEARRLKLAVSILVMNDYVGVYGFLLAQ